jgi:hypothetical protein
VSKISEVDTEFKTLLSRVNSNGIHRIALDADTDHEYLRQSAWLGLGPALLGLAPRRVGTPLVGRTTDHAKNALKVYSLYFFIFYDTIVIIEIAAHNERENL